jgi:hypothetical protein
MSSSILNESLKSISSTLFQRVDCIMSSTHSTIVQLMRKPLYLDNSAKREEWIATLDQYCADWRRMHLMNNEMRVFLTQTEATQSLHKALLEPLVDEM